MKHKTIDRITYIFYWINIIGIVIYILWMIFIFATFQTDYYDRITDTKNWYKLIAISYVFYAPSIMLWLYCLRFCYKYDRYSKNFLPLLILNVFYVPFYYYKVKIKGRPLINQGKRIKEPVLGSRIQLEEYEDESEFENDVKNI